MTQKAQYRNLKKKKKMEWLWNVMHERRVCEGVLYTSVKLTSISRRNISSLGCEIASHWSLRQTHAVLIPYFKLRAIHSSNVPHHRSLQQRCVVSPSCLISWRTAELVWSMYWVPTIQRVDYEDKLAEETTTPLFHLCCQTLLSFFLPNSSDFTAPYLSNCTIL